MIYGAFRYSKHLLEYCAKFSCRQTMAISVHPSGSIEVTAPIGTSREEIERRLSKRGRWVLRQRAYFEQFRPRSPLRRFVGGETHLYLGRQYRLKLIRDRAESIKLKHGYLTVACSHPFKPAATKKLVMIWYRERATMMLRERFDAITPRFAQLGLLPVHLVLRQMSRRWGSYTAAGTISLNPDLIRAPTCCIDYVIVHELIHLAHPDHGSEFYGMLDAMMPDWRARKLRLERLLS